MLAGVQTQISVRGEARRTVPPEYATLYATIHVAGHSRTDALERVASVQDVLVARLSALGGVRLADAGNRAALTWSLSGVSTYDEHDLDKITGAHGPTGRTVADATVVVTLRELRRMDEVSAAVATVDHLDVNQVAWGVDEDNSAWPHLRSDAIAAAVDKARQFAAALGGRLTTVDHVADTGLLGSGERPGFHAVAASRTVEFSGGPSFDPVAQELVAVVEARCVATTDALTEQGRRWVDPGQIRNS
jgi:uncharacterized protein YggE